ncbi:MAG: hypothetical protein JWP85_2828 [Rhodoglobus sp.]|nr:hypothetical protein [Rhodoglobus sp.]
MFFALIIFALPVSAQALRFEQRGLYMNSSTPGATTFYTLSFRYMSPAIVGSVDMQYCIDPIPYHPCVAPPGLDVSHAVISSQTGETGFSISTQTSNHIVISRTPTLMASGDSSYKFDNIVNPTDTNQSFSVRLRSHGSDDATGPQIDFGSVKGQVVNGIEIQTQVPPMLIFCLAEAVDNDCATSNDNYYTDMGQLKADSTLTAQSQMMVGTNATAGFAITANGTPMAAGTSVIDAPSTPTVSKQGTNQFGINLVANSSPAVGSDPNGVYANAVPAVDYGIPNQYKFVSGDVVAYSPNVTLMKKFTVSYVVNSREDLRPGVYSTTITYIASGRF